MRTTIAILAVLLLAACNGPTEPDDTWADPATIQFHASLGVDLAEMTLTESGLYWRDLTEGTEPMAGIADTITVHYTGWLPDGTQFDTSRDKNPLQFQLGVGLMIKGWDEGLVGMRLGGRRQLVIPPHLAYGRRGKGPVPPLMTIVFEVELLAVK